MTSSGGIVNRQTLDIVGHVCRMDGDIVTPTTTAASEDMLKMTRQYQVSVTVSESAV